MNLVLWLAAGLTSIVVSGDRVFSSGLDGAVRSWSNDASRVVASRDYNLYAVASHGGQVAFCGDSRSVDFVTGQRLELPSGWCMALAFSPDGKTLAVAGSEKSVLLFDVASGKLTRTIDTKRDSEAVTWSPDGKVLASGAVDVSLWNPSDGTLIRKLAPSARIRSIAFSPEGTRIAAASYDKAVRVWNTATGELIRTLEPQGFVHFNQGKAFVEPIALPQLAVDFSPDGTKIATAGADRAVRIWDIDTGKELQNLQGHRMSITGLVFLDADRLVSCSLDGTTRVWNVGH